MANKKVNVLRAKVYDFESKELPKGEQSLDGKLADKLIKLGVAEEVKAKAKSE